MKFVLNRKKVKMSFVTLTISGLLFLHFYVPRFITEIENPLVKMARGRDLRLQVSFKNSLLKGKEINFKSFDNTELSCYLTYSNLDTVKGTIILLHGIRSNKESFVSLSAKLSKLGYNSVALDSRAHGKSKGIHCTFGVKEKRDISELITLLEKQENIANNIGVWGKSLGGAIGLQSLGSDKRIQFGIIESAFSDFSTITNDYFNYHLGFNNELFTNYLIRRAGLIANFDYKDARPIKYCKKINQSIVLVHGRIDKRININYARANFAAIPSKFKEFIEIKNANHLNVWQIGGDKYFDSIIEFIEKSSKRKTNVLG